MRKFEIGLIAAMGVLVFSVVGMTAISDEPVDAGYLVAQEETVDEMGTGTMDTGMDDAMADAMDAEIDDAMADAMDAEIDDAMADAMDAEIDDAMADTMDAEMDVGTMDTGMDDVMADTMDTGMDDTMSDTMDTGMDDAMTDAMDTGIMEPEASLAPSSAEVDIVIGSSFPGCEATECYSPSVVVVAVGGTVTWINDDAVHTVTAGNLETDQIGVDHPGGFDSELMMTDSTFEHTFNEKGEYPYFCLLHPWMEGTVIVE